MLTNEQLAAFCGEQNIACVTGEPMKNHTSFQIGGPAALLVQPASVEQLRALLGFCGSCGISPLIIGNGSDLLVCDEGLTRPVVQVSGKMNAMRVESDLLYCEAGAALVKVCAFAQEHALTGLEFAYGIPGNVGGAVFMNAGAYGGEMKDVVASVKHITLQGEAIVLSGAACNFGYRHSVYAENGCCIAEVCFQLKHGNSDEIQSKMDDLMARRVSKQPLEYPSAGSTFKRPVGGYASELIDRCGLKGRRVGGAMVSEKHAGFIINCENAAAADVLALVKLVQNEVEKKTGIALECEIKMVRDEK